MVISSPVVRVVTTQQHLEIALGRTQTTGRPHTFASARGSAISTQHGSSNMAYLNEDEVSLETKCAVGCVAILESKVSGKGT